MPQKRTYFSLIFFGVLSLSCFGFGPRIETHFIGDFKTFPSARTEWIKKTLKLKIDEVGHNLFAASFYLNWKPGQTNIIGQGEGTINRKGRLVFYFKDNYGNQGYGIFRKVPNKAYDYHSYELNFKITHSVHWRTTEQYRTYIVQKQMDALD